MYQPYANTSTHLIIAQWIEEGQKPEKKIQWKIFLKNGHARWKLKTSFDYVYQAALRYRLESMYGGLLPYTQLWYYNSWLFMVHTVAMERDPGAK